MKTGCLNACRALKSTKKKKKQWQQLTSHATKSGRSQRKGCGALCVRAINHSPKPRAGMGLKCCQWRKRAATETDVVPIPLNSIWNTTTLLKLSQQKQNILKAFWIIKPHFIALKSLGSTLHSLRKYSQRESDVSQQADTEQSQWPVILLADGLISATKAKMTTLKTLVWLDGGDTQKAALILLYHSWRFSTHASAGTNQTWRSNFNDTPRLTKTLLPRGVYAIKSAHDQSLKETFYWLLWEYCITTITTVISALSLSVGVCNTWHKATLKPGYLLGSMFEKYYSVLCGTLNSNIPKYGPIFT